MNTDDHMVSIRLTDDDLPQRFAATRVSTDEHNNLEVWGGKDAETLLYLCAAENWVDITIHERDT